ncbi:hypothetical protein [Microvirga aerophila]|uniref:Uncharacterized protein n=1 Tax=Microvirga aerophila TaxID=670291 RepID=A0A512BNN1_9HYPH|nr:hypothetical protein [Microvirga aerophila]GEO13525.1 hypothetical protein MAE02_12210 [Microvirga aerophila]
MKKNPRLTNPQKRKLTALTTLRRWLEHWYGETDDRTTKQHITRQLEALDIAISTLNSNPDWEESSPWNDKYQSRIRRQSPRTATRRYFQA